MRLLATVVAASLTVASPASPVAISAEAFACSFVPSPDSPPLFTVPWLKGVIRGAVAIVRVRVPGLPPGSVRSLRSVDVDTVQATVLERHAGAAVPDTLRLLGRLHDSDVYPSDTIPYLHAGYSTMCYQADFRRGGEHLLLLWQREDSTWTTFGPVFAPSVIQVRGSGDAWVQWVMGVRTGRIP